MALPISSIPAGRAADIARRVDAEGDNDGTVTEAEAVAAKSRIDAGATGWDDNAKAGLTELAGLLGIGGSAPFTPPVAPTAPDLFGAVDVSRLNETQRTAIRNAEMRAAPLSAAAHASLLQKVTALGFTEADLNTVLESLRTKPPMTVNFSPDKTTQAGTPLIDAFLAAPDYRNQFETHITSGSPSAVPGGSRDNWEKTIFSGDYHTHALVADERPKYGAMNVEGCAKGGATSYGSCYFILKNEVKDRATFTPSNSSGCQASQVGTVRSFEHVLNALDTSRLTNAMNVALGRPSAASGASWSYVEMQVHGPLQLDKDVDTVVLATQFKGTPYEAKLRDMAARYHLAISWTDGVTVTPEVPAAPVAPAVVDAVAPVAVAAPVAPAAPAAVVAPVVAPAPGAPGAAAPAAPATPSGTTPT